MARGAASGGGERNAKLVQPPGGNQKGTSPGGAKQPFGTCPSEPPGSWMVSQQHGATPNHIWVGSELLEPKELIPWGTSPCHHGSGAAPGWPRSFVLPSFHPDLGFYLPFCSLLLDPPPAKSHRGCSTQGWRRWNRSRAEPGAFICKNIAASPPGDHQGLTKCSWSKENHHEAARPHPAPGAFPAPGGCQQHPTGWARSEHRCPHAPKDLSPPKGSEPPAGCPAAGAHFFALNSSQKEGGGSQRKPRQAPARLRAPIPS